MCRGVPAQGISRAAREQTSDGNLLEARRLPRRRTRCPSYKGRITASDARLATPAPAFLVYRRAVGDGRDSKPQSRRGVEFRLQRRRTRCPSYKDEVHRERSPTGNARTRLPRLPPSRRRRPGLQTAIATRYQIPLPTATDKMSVVQREEVHHDRRPLGNACTRSPRLPPSHRRRPGLQTVIATRCRIPTPAATDKMSVVQRGGSPRATPTRQRRHPISSFTAEP
ncbi:MAG: hypothetical protein RLY70_1694 [Planctomycetota bacterium]